MKDWIKLLETSRSASILADAGKPEDARRMMEEFQSESGRREKDKNIPDLRAEPQSA